MYSFSKYLSVQVEGKLWYHGTPEKFNSFEYRNNDIGFHFGTIEQATQRLNDLGKTGHIIKAKLNIKNPIRLPDVSHFTVENIKQVLKDKSEFNKDPEFHKIKNPQHLRDYLTKKGYDGIIYKNTKEVPEASEYLNKAESHLQKFREDTGYTEFNAPKSIKDTNENYLLSQLYHEKAAKAIKKHAKDSVIAFGNSQIIRQLSV